MPWPSGVPAVAFLEEADLVIVTHAFGTSCLGYLSILHVKLSLKSVWKLQLVQNSPAGVCYLEDATPVLFGLPWFPVCFEAKFRMPLNLTFKSLNGLGLNTYFRVSQEYSKVFSYMILDILARDLLHSALIWIHTAGQSSELTWCRMHQWQILRDSRGQQIRGAFHPESVTAAYLHLAINAKCNNLLLRRPDTMWQTLSRRSRLFRLCKKCTLELCPPNQASDRCLLHCIAGLTSKWWGSGGPMGAPVVEWVPLVEK